MAAVHRQPDPAGAASSVPLLKIIEDTVQGLVGERWHVNPVGALDLLPGETARVLKDAGEATATTPACSSTWPSATAGGARSPTRSARCCRTTRPGAPRSRSWPRCLDVEHIAEHLYTAGQPDPDLVIRTSGEQRLGGFLLWQSTHSEFYFCDAYWPAFRKVDFLRALRSYAARNRRFGYVTAGSGRYPRDPRTVTRCTCPTAWRCFCRNANAGTFSSGGRRGAVRREGPRISRASRFACRRDERKGRRRPFEGQARSRPTRLCPVVAPGSPRRPGESAWSIPQGRRTYVLDTSVLLADPAAIARFAEHQVVLPVVVITELEAKRHHPELGYFARQALRHLDDLRIEHGRLDAELPVGDAGRHGPRRAQPLRPARCCPPGSGSGTTTRGSCPWRAASPPRARDVVLVSKDLPLRVKAAAVGLTAQEYRAELPVDSGWTGMTELDVSRG